MTGRIRIGSNIAKSPMLDVFACAHFWLHFVADYEKMTNTLSLFSEAKIISKILKVCTLRHPEGIFDILEEKHMSWRCVLKSE